MFDFALYTKLKTQKSWKVFLCFKFWQELVHVNCNLNAKMTKKLKQKLKGQDIVLEEKNKISDVSKLSILSFTQNKKLWKSWKVCFYFKF